MTPPPPAGRQSATRRPPALYAAAACLILALLAPACTGGGARPLLTGEAATADSSDPSTSPYASWRPVDHAVIKGCAEHVVVATPVRDSNYRYRTYTLLGPRDQPGELVVTRGEDGLSLSLRFGRFGDPEMEASILASVRRELNRDRPGS